MFNGGETHRIFSNATACESVSEPVSSSQDDLCHRELRQPLEEFSEDYCANSDNQSSSFCTPDLPAIGIEDFPEIIREQVSIYETALRVLRTSGLESPAISSVTDVPSAMINNPNEHQMFDVTLGENLSVRSFRETGLDHHIFFYNGGMTAFRGEATIVWSRSRWGIRRRFILGSGSAPERIPGRGRVDLVVLYPETFGRVTFRDVPSTIIRSRVLNEMTSRIGNSLPRSLFVGLRGFVIYPETHSRDRSYYDPETQTINMIGLSVSVNRILHELGHNWEHQAGRDIIQIFRRISWNIIRTPGNFSFDPPRRISDDQDDFFDVARSRYCQSMTCRSGPRGSTIDLYTDDHLYGMENEHEDFAMLISGYHGRPEDLRQRIRTQMQNGNFELAVKYLFARYCVYEGREYRVYGREYQVNDQSFSLGLFEIRQAINLALSESSESERTNLIRLRDIIEEIMAAGHRFLSENDLENPAARVQ